MAPEAQGNLLSQAGMLVMIAYLEFQRAFA
jgi:hypothetical protein